MKRCSLRITAGDAAAASSKKTKTERAANDAAPPALDLLLDGIHEFFVPLLVDYLDPASLVRLAAASKHLQREGKKEIGRRKHLVAQHEEGIRQLIGVAGDERTPYTRAVVLQAKELHLKAWLLVTGDRHATWNLELAGMNHHPFRDELEKFKTPDLLVDEDRHLLLNADMQPRSPLNILPDRFYCPVADEIPVEPTEMMCRVMMADCRWLLVWYMEYLEPTDGPEDAAAEKLLYKGIDDVAESCAKVPGALEAFRQEARNIAFRVGFSRGLFDYAIFVAEKKKKAAAK